ncbi:MAG: hypothetical protein HOM58_19605 [Rhodospirillaceae bacterium]|jgi:hypothetical protein|nr:hypothetical protein [Rhodospirillaceae bacterium]MBT5457558.1 hypothetical protein [Rhodospirillaceae bacterium]
MGKNSTRTGKAGLNRRTVLKDGVRLSALVATLGVSVGVDFSSVQAADLKKKVIQDKFRRSRGVRQNKLSPGVRQDKVSPGVLQDKVTPSVNQNKVSPGSRAIQEKAFRSRTLQDKSSRKR